jgi:hypothetical protein
MRRGLPALGRRGNRGLQMASTAMFEIRNPQFP